MRIPNEIFAEIAKEAVENAPSDIIVDDSWDLHSSDRSVEDLEEYVREVDAPMFADVYRHIAYGRDFVYYEAWFIASQNELLVRIANRLLPQDVGNGHIKEIDVSDCRNFKEGQ